MTPNTHTDPPLDTSDHEPKRFTDQRGIALQTVIIMVVMLAIAGGVAAVLLTRGQTASEQLENSALGAPARTYTSESFCRSAGFTWVGTEGTPEDRCKYPNEAACIAAGGKGYNAKASIATADPNDSFCNTAGATFLGKIV